MTGAELGPLIPPPVRTWLEAHHISPSTVKSYEWAETGTSGPSGWLTLTVWVTVVDWHAYRRCPVCRRETGEPCVALSSAVVDGQPDGTLSPLTVAHKARRRRSGR